MSSPKSFVKFHKFVDAFAQQVYCFGDGCESPAHTSMELVKTPKQNALRKYKVQSTNTMKWVRTLPIHGYRGTGLGPKGRAQGPAPKTHAGPDPRAAQSWRSHDDIFAASANFAQFFAPAGAHFEHVDCTKTLLPLLLSELGIFRDQGGVWTCFHIFMCDLLGCPFGVFD